MLMESATSLLDACNFALRIAPFCLSDPCLLSIAPLAIVAMVLELAMAVEELPAYVLAVL